MGMRTADGWGSIAEEIPTASGFICHRDTPTHGAIDTRERVTVANRYILCSRASRLVKPRIF